MPDRNAFLSTFGSLNFRFEESNLPDGRSRLVAFAPSGRVGIAEILELREGHRYSLLISSGSDRKTECWSATCVGALATMLESEFHGWVGQQLRWRGRNHRWSAKKCFGSLMVWAAFFPMDSVVVTIDSREPSGPSLLRK
jgi:hypothetical protein